MRERCEPEVLDVAYDGANQASPAPGVLEAIRDADAILICPSNPDQLDRPHPGGSGNSRAPLAKTRARVIAVSPIVGERR